MKSKKKACPNCKRAKLSQMADGSWRCTHPACDVMFPKSHEDWLNRTAIEESRTVKGKLKCCAPVNDAGSGSGWCKHFATSSPRHSNHLKKYDAAFRGMICTAHYWQMVADALIKIIETTKRPNAHHHTQGVESSLHQKDLIIDGVKFEPEEQDQALDLVTDSDDSILESKLGVRAAEGVRSFGPVKGLSDLAMAPGWKKQTWINLLQWAQESNE